MKGEKEIEEKESERILLEPGKDNQQERLNFVRYWAHYVKTHKDEEWSEQQNVVIDGQVGE